MAEYLYSLWQLSKGSSDLHCIQEFESLSEAESAAEGYLIDASQGVQDIYIGKCHRIDTSYDPRIVRYYIDISDEE